jgi:hypothetical protein
MSDRQTKIKAKLIVCRDNETITKQSNPVELHT